MNVSPANRIRSAFPPGTAGVPEIRHFGLIERFTAPGCGCPGSWTLHLVARWYEPWQRPVETWEWDCWVGHRAACRRANS